MLLSDKTAVVYGAAGAARLAYRNVGSFEIACAAVEALTR